MPATVAAVLVDFPVESTHHVPPAPLRLADTAQKVCPMKQVGVPLSFALIFAMIFSPWVPAARNPAAQFEDEVVAVPPLYPRVGKSLK